MKFFDYSICRRKTHCSVCRDRANGKAWRDSIKAIYEWDGESCIDNKPMRGTRLQERLVIAIGGCCDPVNTTEPEPPAIGHGVNWKPPPPDERTETPQ